MLPRPLLLPRFPLRSASRWNHLAAAGVVGLCLVGCSWFGSQGAFMDSFSEDFTPVPRSQPPGELRPGVRGVMVERVHARGASIAWESRWKGESVVTYGQSPRLLPQAALTTPATNGRQALLSGLSPGTRYFFQVETRTMLGVARSPVCSFRTP